MRDQALNDFGLEGTPTFYVNGKQLSGEKTLDQLCRRDRSAAAIRRRRPHCNPQASIVTQSGPPLPCGGPDFAIWVGMKFTRLKLHGFKSFSDLTELYLEPGLTGVVGPNGCGKSNLVEALRWVMGESSYKAMRASGMDDVIFSGSGNRPARNSAEVTLVLDNSDRTAPATLNNADVLEVTRRIEREEGSVYRVNGKEVRARDVQLLFADASTGAHSPALVRQGQIGELIAAKPQARRALLEEAAGISGLHSRRHEAELRLRGGRAESRARRRRHRPGDAAARTAEAPGAARDALSRPQRRNPQGRGDAVPYPLDRGARRREGNRGRAGPADQRPRRCAARRARSAEDRVHGRPGRAAAARQGSRGRRGAAAAHHPRRATGRGSAARRSAARRS